MIDKLGLLYRQPELQWSYSEMYILFVRKHIKAFLASNKDTLCHYVHHNGAITHHTWKTPNVRTSKFWRDYEAQYITLNSIVVGWELEGR